jgi:hypothetical protein
MPSTALWGRSERTPRRCLSYLRFISLQRPRPSPVFFQKENGADVFGQPFFAHTLALGFAGIGEAGVEPGVDEGFEQ